MSIIHNALKKVQGNHKEESTNPSTPKKQSPTIYDKLQKKKPFTNPSSETQSVQPQAEQNTSGVVFGPKKRNIVFISLIITFGLFIIVFLAFLVFFIGQNISAGKSDSFKAPFLSKKNPAETDGIALSGIMMMGEKHVALINGNIYELGEFVEGKKITSITLKQVQLLKEDGTTIKLGVRKGK